MENCLFCKIVAGDIKADILHEDDQCLAFKDISPQAPMHYLIIPKQHLASLNELHDTSLAGKLMLTAASLAKSNGFAEQGYRTVINCNQDGGQTVYHLHMHLLAGRPLQWPPG